MRVHNFSAGPAAIPTDVLKRARDELLDFRGRGTSIMEISHRSALFGEVHEAALAGVRRNLAVPDDYEVLFIQGGASLQFAMAPMNLALPGRPIEVLNTGRWTEKALAEIATLSPSRVVADTAKERRPRLPRPEEMAFSGRASYVHLCSNNTVMGTQWHDFPDVGDVPLVADMSSDIFSRPIDVSRFGLIFAGAQKNIGPSGMALVIVRRDLVDRAPADLPTMLQYRTYVKSNSLYNTPNTWAIYMAGLVMDWIEAQGGVAALDRINRRKAALLYDAIDRSEVFTCPVAASDRSLMNVVFRSKEGDEELERRFVAEAEAAGLMALKGHRSIGGLRASIYNAVPEASVRALVDFIEEFERRC